MGSYSSHVLHKWDVFAGVDRDVVVRRMPDNPDMWSDGSFVLNNVSGASSCGSHIYARALGDAWRHRSGGTLMWCSWHMEM